MQNFPFLVRRILDKTTVSIRASITLLWKFLKEEAGQDLIEYTLPMAFIALASSALFLGAGKNVKGIWTDTNSQLSTANSNLSGS
jgi:Flp pilus assembly pilin Flp